MLCIVEWVIILGIMFLKRWRDNHGSSELEESSEGCNSTSTDGSDAVRLDK